jgi:hypothetical protein
VVPTSHLKVLFISGLKRELWFEQFKKKIKVAKRDGSSEINSQGNVDQQCTDPLSFHC